MHGYDEPIGVPKNWEEEDGEIVLADRMATQEALNLSVEDKNHGGCGYFASSVVSAAVGKGTNLCATGAGDGTIRLWKATPGEKDTALEPKHSLPQRGFVNGLAIASSGKFLLAGVGQEPRLGRGEETQERKMEWSCTDWITSSTKMIRTKTMRKAMIPWMKKRTSEIVGKIIAALVFSSR